MKVYLAGPMRGLPDWNFPAFEEARNRWRSRGHQVFCPAAIFSTLGYETHTGEDRGHCLQAIQIDLACIYAAEAIALLPGWEKSRGATVEVSVAQFLSLPIYDAMTEKEMKVLLSPYRFERKAFAELTSRDMEGDPSNGDWAEVWRTSVDRCVERAKIEESRRG